MLMPWNSGSGEERRNQHDVRDKSGRAALRARRRSRVSRGTNWGFQPGSARTNAQPARTAAIQPARAFLLLSPATPERYSFSVKTKPKRLTPHLTNRLVTYAAAAGATTFLASTAANAEVVYTPVHAKVGYEYPLDLNHDGINDFRLHSFELSGIGSLTVYPLHQGNRIAATAQICGRLPGRAAAALPTGVVIGPNNKFSVKATCMISSFSSEYNGAWNLAQDRYLGLVFVIDGQEHFGWARLTNRGANNTDILGYAYETVPNKAIRAGDEGDANATNKSGTLGELALGAASKPARGGN